MNKHTLKQQVDLLKRKKIENEDIDDIPDRVPKKSTPNELGKKSIFYDPDWNPAGKAPFGLKNVPYNPKTFRRNEELEPRLCGLKNIPPPDSKKANKDTAVKK